MHIFELIFRVIQHNWQKSCNRFDVFRRQVDPHQVVNRRQEVQVPQLIKGRPKALKVN